MSDSTECRAFRTCFRKLVGGISNPSLLAVSLYSEGIISNVTRVEVTSTNLLLTDRVLKLLDAVERQMEGNPVAFFSFVDALREDSSQVFLVKFLMSAYYSSRKRKREQPHAQLFDIPGENWEIADKFSVALKTIKGFLTVQPRELKEYLCCLCHPLKPDELYVQSHHYESATTTSEIIESLFPKFINYQNTGLLRQVVLRFGCDKCKAALQEYLQHYSKFTDKKVCNMPNAVSDGELDRATGVKRLRVETNMTLEEATIADTEAVQNGLGQATGIDPYFISPAQHDPGSVILTFLVPNSVCEIFCELCEEDIEILANCGITRLQIEDCMIENIHEYCTNANGEIEQKTAIPQENMQKPCSNEFLQRLALTIGDSTELVPYLGITGPTEQTASQYHSMEEQTYQALLQWKQLYQDSATYEHLVELLVHHAFFSTVETALNIISPANIVQKARHVLQHAYLAVRSCSLWPGAPRMMEFSQRLGKVLTSDLESNFDFLALDYSSHIANFPAAVDVVSVKSFLNVVSQKQQRLFLLKGPHGSGKTTLLQRACSLWARGLCWRKFTLVFWVDMKALAIALAPDPQYSFMKLMRYVVPEGVDLRGICHWMHMHDGQDSLLVLDGIDSFTNSAFLDAILSEPCLEKGSVVTTSSSPEHLFTMKCPQYYLLGLCEDQIMRQVTSYYSDSPGKAEAFFSFISAAPAIKVLCSNPPCLAAVLCVFDSGYPSDLPATWTELFKQLILHLIGQCPTLDQPTIDQPILQELAKWTHHGTLCHVGVIPKPLRPFFNMVTPPYTISAKSAMIYSKFSLPRLAFSYLTSVRIHTLPLKEQIALMDSQTVGDYVWQFFAGLCSSMRTFPYLADHVYSRPFEYATCLHEARNIGSPKAGKSKLTLNFNKELLTAYETHVILSVAQNSSKPCRVTVQARLLEAGTLAEMGRCLTADSILGTGGIGELSIYCAIGEPKPLQALARGVAASCTLKKLNLSWNTIHDAGVSALARALRVNQSLEELDLEHTGLSAEGTSALASALCVNHSLKILNLFGNKILDAGISALAGALRVNQSLEKLDLGNTQSDLSAEGASALASALCVNHSLKVLKFSLTSILDAGVFALAGALRVNQSLEKLDLRHTGLSAEGASALASALCVNYSLKALNLIGNRIYDAGVSALAGALRVNQSLEELHIDMYGTTGSGVSVLADALEVNNFLTKLDLFNVSRGLEERLRDIAKRKGINITL